MPNDLDQVAATAPKNVEIAGMSITNQTLLHQSRKARGAAAHIGVAGRRPPPHITQYSNHRTLKHLEEPRHASDVRIHSDAPPTTDRPPLSPAGESFGVSSGPRAAICIGAKNGTTCSDLRAYRRRVNTRLAATPLERATAVTFAPGANDSSVPCHPATSAADAPARPKPRPTSPDDLKARLKITPLANSSVSDKTARA